MISKSPDGNVKGVDDMVNQVLEHRERILEIEGWSCAQCGMELGEERFWRIDAHRPTAIGMVPATNEAHLIPSVPYQLVRASVAHPSLLCLVMNLQASKSVRMLRDCLPMWLLIISIVPACCESACAPDDRP